MAIIDNKVPTAKVTLPPVKHKGVSTEGQSPAPAPQSDLPPIHEAFKTLDVSDDLATWWMNRAAEEVDPMVRKAAEYGGGGRAGDLIEIGRAMVASGVAVTGGSDEELTELSIYFYLVGKFARWQAAIKEGRRVSDDTIYDIGIYTRMAQRNRDMGGWPQ